MKYFTLIVLASCGGNVPDKPTYFSDVEAILRANCVRCHGADQIDPKIAKFRLDRYVKNDADTFDVWDYASGSDPAIMHYAVDLEAPAMPPDYALTERQREILARWMEQGAPKGTRTNQLPQIALIDPSDATTADQSLAVTYRAWDDDLDGLYVQLWSKDLANDDRVPLDSVTGGGLRSVTIDTGTLASKHDFEIYATLDDGFDDDPANNKIQVSLISALHVDHGARGTAPTVKLVAPNGGDTLIGTTTISWTASDPDVDLNGNPDVLSIDLDLMKVAADGTETLVAPIISALPNTGTYPWTIPSSVAATDGSGNPLRYRVRVTASDSLGIPPNTRSDESDTTFTIASSVTTTYTWPDVKPIFETYCGSCHGDPARTVAIDYFCLLQYQTGEATPPCAAGDQGAFEVKGLVYQRLVSAKTMPPATAPQPSQADRDKVGSWILGGAPFGSGPTDARPMFAWDAPASSSAAAMATVTITWHASDDVGLQSGVIEVAEITGSSGSGCANLITTPTWAAINDPKAMASLGGATTWSDSFAYMPTVKMGKYHCVRGKVVDTSNQTTIIVNPFGLK